MKKIEMKRSLSLKAIALLGFTFTQLSLAGVCDRSLPVYRALERVTGKSCQNIEAADLEKIVELKLPHLHIKSFQEIDFIGLSNLRKLQFHSLLHNAGTPNAPIAIGERVFNPLSSLEELEMQESLGLLPDGVFSGLVALKILNLRDAELNRLPQSMLNLPSIEKVYFDGTGMSVADYEVLKNHLGAKLVEAR